MRTLPLPIALAKVESISSGIEARLQALMPQVVESLLTALLIVFDAWVDDSQHVYNVRTCPGSSPTNQNVRQSLLP
jgi:hypothetical protein